jgi:drug/metabolite transporter (DMT)-like permease
MNTPHISGVACAIAACLCVSTAIVATKAVVGQAPILAIFFVQVLAATIVVGVAAALMNKLPTRRQFLKLAAPGVLQPAGAYIFTFLGLAVVPASIEGLLSAFESAMIALMAWPLLRERSKRKTKISVALGTLGVLMLSLPQRGDFDVPIAGVLLIMAGVFCGALDTIVSRALVADADPLAMTAAALAAALAVAALALALAAPLSSPQFWSSLLDAKTLVLVVSAGVLLHGCAPLLFNHALARMTAGEAGAVIPSISAFSVIGAYAFLGERLNLMQIAGGLAVLASALVIAWRHEPDGNRAHVTLGGSKSGF